MYKRNESKIDAEYGNCFFCKHFHENDETKNLNTFLKEWKTVFTINVRFQKLKLFF